MQHTGAFCGGGACRGAQGAQASKTKEQKGIEQADRSVQNAKPKEKNVLAVQRARHADQEKGSEAAGGQVSGFFAALRQDVESWFGRGANR
jgi:hypothetical protein